MNIEFNKQDLANLRSAVRRNPQKVLSETRKFLQRGIGAYLRTIDSNPWRLGMAGGGVPIDTGNLRDSHKPPIYSTWEARIEANRTGTAPYYVYIHEGTRKMQERPWLDYAVKNNEKEIYQLSEQLLDTLTSDLAK